jgi:hypothetical protein
MAAVAAIGLLIGLRFRAPALIAATAATVLTCAFAYGRDGIDGRGDVLASLGLVLLLQCAYLAGLCLATLWRRIGGSR